MKNQIEHAAALNLAQSFIRLIESDCERIKIAGSLRRRCKQVGDIEVVCIPKLERNLLGEDGDSLLERRLTELVKTGSLSPPGKNGPRYKQFQIANGRIQLDLFIASPERWGVIFAIRTGSAAFSKSLVTTQERGGRLDDGLVVLEGRVRRGPDLLDTPEEIDFLALAGDWVEPEERCT